MKRLTSLTFLVVAASAIGQASSASAFERPLLGARASHGAQASSWHGDYYHVAWGAPVALVVPPRAKSQTHWGWGVGNTRVTPINPQFEHAYPGPAVGGQGFLPTPPWPSDTDQFGVYYVRGPWQPAR